MSLPGTGQTPTFIQNPNPKSILADRRQSPNNNAMLRMNDMNNLRVTFAQAISMRRSTASSSTSLNQTPPATGKDAEQNSSRPKSKHPYQANRLNYGGFRPDPKNRPWQNMSSTKPDDKQSSPNEQDKGSKLGRRSAKNISVLYPSDKSKKYKPRLSPGSSVGVFLAGSKSNESIGRQDKTEAGTGTKSGKSTSRTKKSTRSLVSNPPRRVKSGKKLKKRRTSKASQLDKDMESFKPAKLDEEYASELSKITQILKAVSAFDESTATANGAVNYSTSSRNNIVTHYTYMEPSRSLVAAGAASSSYVRRPLSGDELKQLLSSITRVVSLHQLPNTTTTQLMPSIKNAYNAGAGLRTSSPPISADEYNFDLLKKNTAATEASTVNGAESPPPSVKPKKKKSRKTVRPSFSGLMRRKSDSGDSPGRSYLRKSSKPNYKSGKGSKLGRAHSKDSVSSSERDPVKNALFLRKYFEESIRLANKKSSDELLDEENNKQKKKRSKKKSLSKKASAKTVTRKSLNNTT